MFIKSKICFTVLVIYEIVAISLLHFQRTCDAMFTPAFCDSNFKYFAGAIAVPLLIYLIWMWLHEIFVARRRRRFISRAKNMINTIASNIHEGFENLSPHAIEGIITAAIILGIQKYSLRHPGLRKKIGQIIGISNGDITDFEYEINSGNVSDNVRKRANARNTSSTRTTKKKK